MLYDMVFNTEKVSVDACIDMIVATGGPPGGISRPRSPPPDSTTWSLSRT